MANPLTGMSAQGYRWITGSVLLVTFAQLGMKIGMSHLPGAPALWEAARALAVDSLLGYWPWLMLIGSGIVAYGLSMMCWLKALQHLPLSRAYPLLSISYITVYAVAVFTPVLHEAFKVQHVVGIVMILAGVLVISRWGNVRSAGSLGE